MHPELVVQVGAPGPAEGGEGPGAARARQEAGPGARHCIGLWNDIRLSRANAQVTTLTFFLSLKKFQMKVLSHVKQSYEITTDKIPRAR